jgi:hypothetical protein
MQVPLQERARMHVTVLDRNGRRVPDARVVLTADPDDFVLRASVAPVPPLTVPPDHWEERTGAKGELLFPDLTPGVRLVASVWHGQWGRLTTERPISPLVLASGESCSMEIRLDR